MSTVHIGELSRLTDVNIETIRYYEREGVLPKAARDRGGRRIYGDGDVRRLNFIHKCRGLGFSLEEIASLLSLVDCRSYSCDQVRQLSLNHAAELSRKIVDLTRMERVLIAMARQCNRGNIPDCPILDSLFEGQGGRRGG